MRDGGRHHPGRRPRTLLPGARRIRSAARPSAAGVGVRTGDRARRRVRRGQAGPGWPAVRLVRVGDRARSPGHPRGRGGARELRHGAGEPALGSLGDRPGGAGGQGSGTRISAASSRRREPAGPGADHPARGSHVRRAQHHDDVGGPVPRLGLADGRALCSPPALGFAASGDAGGPVVRRAVLLGRHPGAEESRPPHGPSDRDRCEYYLSVLTLYYFDGIDGR